MQQLINLPEGAASPLFASGAVSVDLDPTFLMHFLFFTAFIVVMKDLIFDPMLRVFEERERRTAGAIVQARRMDEEAISLRQEYETKLEGVRREASVDRERVRGKVNAIEAKLSAEARAEADAKLDAGLAALDEDAEKIRRNLQASRGPLAAEIASKILGREVNR